MKEKLILDACCGGRMFWFDRKHKNALFVDRRVVQPRIVGHGKHGRVRSVLPDKVMDFRNLDLESKKFNLVVFDPPHLFAGEKSHMAQIYGSLDKETWKEDLRLGFSECFRVLKEGGVLIFKWNESDIPLREILKLTTVQPLFGHRSGKSMKTHWLCFMKIPATAVKCEENQMGETREPLMVTERSPMTTLRERIEREIDRLASLPYSSFKKELTTAILQAFREELPDEKENIWNNALEAEGWNACLAAIRKGMEG